MEDANRRKRILDFWFNRPPMEWIVAPPGLDEEIKSQFGELVTRASDSDELDHWARDAEGSLALITLLSQFSKNLYRNTAEAFRNDAKAYDITIRALERGFDRTVGVLEATGFYLVLLSREDVAAARRAKGLFEGLLGREGLEEGEREWVELCGKAAERHAGQLERFGRYPTRNEVLGRESTEGEREFLRGHMQSL